MTEKLEKLPTDSQSYFDQCGLMISRVPANKDEANLYDRKMNKAILGILHNECSPSEWASYPRHPAQSLLEKLDEILIRKARVYTWRMQYCEVNRQRYAVWCEDDNGITLKRFHAAIEERTQRSIGKTKGKVTVEWVEGKARAVPDLRALLRLFNREVRLREDRNPAFPEARSRLLQIASEMFSPESWVGQNYRCLSSYLTEVGRNDPARARRICNGEMRAENIFNAMGARDLHISEDHFRNQLSAISWKPSRNIKRKPVSA